MLSNNALYEDRTSACSANELRLPEAVSSSRPHASPSTSQAHGYLTVSLKSPWPHLCRSDAACLCQAVPRNAQPRALPVRFLGESGGVVHKYQRCPGAIQAGYSSVGRASDRRCARLSDGPWFDSRWPDLAWCKHFGIKAGQLS